MPVLTDDEYAKVVAAFKEGYIPVGLGNSESACTVARANLVLTGKLTDGPHPCIDNTVREFIIALQDDIPSDLRNSAAYREVAPKLFLTGGTGVDYLPIVMDGMWGALGLLLPVAEEHGFSAEWRTMLEKRTAAAARAAAAAADAWAVWAAAYAAWAAARATTWVAANAAAWAAADAIVRSASDEYIIDLLNRIADAR